MEIQFIKSADALNAICAQLSASDWIALDTEFIREKTYYPQLCLLQVATDKVLACIDPLAIDDLSPLLDVLYDDHITKVMHAARQDLEILYQLRGDLPRPVFDTQIAATVLGQGEQVGYGNLVKALLGIGLDKAHTRTDWSRRPLDDEQIRYAADDVRYLGDLFRIQKRELTELGRTDWLSEDFSNLTDPEGYRVDPREAWKRIKGANRLKGVQLAVLQKLAAWREEYAMERDRPRRWVVKDEVILELARHMPDSTTRMDRIRGLEPALLRRHGEVLLRLIQLGRKTPRDQWPVLTSKTRLNPAQDAVVDAMAAVVRQRSLEQSVSPGTVASRRDLEKVISGDSDVPVLHGWRGALAGKDLKALLEGRLWIEVTEGVLRLRTKG